MLWVLLFAILLIGPPMLLLPGMGRHLDAETREAEAVILAADAENERREEDRRRAVEHCLMTAREVDHRSRNLLVVVQSLVRRTRADDVESFSRVLYDRIAVLGRAQDLLRERETGAPLHEVVESETATFLDEADNNPLRFTGPVIMLRAEAVQAVAMLLHELATNSSKYGALSTSEGGVVIDWALTPTRLRLVWQEEGGPTVSGPPSRRGFGTTVIDMMVERRLGGTVTREWLPSGLQCRIDVPRDRAQMPAD